jgi:hypothetical protein
MASSRTQCSSAGNQRGRRLALNKAYWNNASDRRANPATAVAPTHMSHLPASRPRSWQRVAATNNPDRVHGGPVWLLLDLTLGSPVPGPVPVRRSQRTLR